MADFHWQESTTSNVPTVAMSGRLDIDTAPELRRVLHKHIGDRPSGLLLDLSGLDFMDTSGLATLIEARQLLQQDGGRLALFGLAAQIAEVFSMAQVEGMFTIVATESEALEALR